MMKNEKSVSRPEGRSRVGGTVAGIVALLAACVLFPAAAYGSGTSVSGVTGPEPNPATATTTSLYTIGFTVSGSGSLAAGTGTITLDFPGGSPATVFPNTPSDYTVNNVAVTTITSGGGTADVTLQTPVAVGNSAAVSVAVNAVTNPSAGSYTGATVATSSDTVPAAVPSYTIVTAPTAVTVNACCTLQPSGTPVGGNPSPDFAASAASYGLKITVSGTGALAAGAGTLALTGPSGTGFPGSLSGYVVNGMVPAAVSGMGTAKVVITTPVDVPDSGIVVLALSGVNNPPEGSYSLSVATSADTQVVQGASYTIAPTPTTVTAVTCCSVGAGVPASGNPVPDGAGSAAAYGLGFTTSASGALAAGSGTITVEAPAGTTLPGSISDYTVNGASVSAVSVSPASCTAPCVVLTMPAGTGAGDSSGVDLVATGVTNAPAGTYTLTVYTSSDLQPVTSSAFTIYSTVTGLTVATDPSPEVTGVPAVYSIGFTTSAAGALAAGKGTITITGPSGTAFPAAAGEYTVSATSDTSQAVPVTVAPGGGATRSVTITTPVAVGGAVTVTVTVAGVRATTASSGNTLSVSTSADKAAAASGRYTTVTPTADQVSGLSINPSDSSANASGVTYTVSFTTSSATGSCGVDNLCAGSSLISLTPSSGTVLPPASASPGDYKVNGTAAPSGSGGGSAGSAVTIASPVSVGSGGTATIAISSVTNPPAGNYTWSLSTSTDFNGATSPFVVIGTPPGTVTAVAAPTVTPDYSGSVAHYAFSLMTSTAASGSPGNLDAGGGTITITTTASTTVFPSGAGDYVVDGVVAPAVSTSGCASAPCFSVTTPVDVGAGATVLVSVSGVTNDTTPSAGYKVYDATSANPTAAASTSPATFSVMAKPTSISNLSGPAPSPASEGATARYTYGFSVSSATGGCGTENLCSGASTITIAPAASTTLPSGSASPASYVVNGVAASAGSGGGSAGASATVTVPVNIAPRGTVDLTVSGVINPAAAGQYADTLSTSTDQAPVATPAYVIGSSTTGAVMPTVSVPAGTAPNYPFLSTNPDPQLGGSAPAEYAVTFGTSSSGALVAGRGTISVTFGTGTVLPGNGAGYTVNGVAASTVSVTGSSVTITTPVNVGDSGSVSVVISGATNPGAGSYQASVVTSSDTVPGPGSVTGYTIGAQITGLAGPSPTPSSAGALNAVYTFTFSASASGALKAGSGTMDLAAPAGTAFPVAASEYVVNGVASTSLETNSSGTCGAPGSYGAASNDVCVVTPVDITDGGAVKLVISAVTNPPAGTYATAVSTSADIQPANTPDYVIGTSVSGVSVSVIPAIGGEQANYAIGFTTSNSPAGSGALAVGKGTITIDAPSGTAFPVPTSSYTVTDLSALPIESAAATVISGGGTNDVTVTTPIPISGGDSVSLSIAGVVNPAPGNYTVTVTTSADQVPAASPSYSIATPSPPVVTGVSPSSGPATGGTAVTISGTDFIAGATVAFGTAPGTKVTVVSSSEISAVSPAEAPGTVDVTVSTYGGTSAKSAVDHFTYEAAYTPLTPARICDTRPNNPSGLSGVAAQCNGKTLAPPGRVLDVTVTGIAGVPAAGVSAVALNVTVVDPSGNGYLTVYPAGKPAPTASNINFHTGDIVANLVEVGVGTGGQVAVTSNTATDVVIDVEGYYSVPGGAGEGLYEPLAPARICDSRAGNPSGLSGPDAQCNGHTLTSGAPLTVQVTGNGGVPLSGVAAVSLNVTAVGFTSNGYLTVYPAGIGAPMASNLNFHVGQGPVPNAVIVPVNTVGQISLVSNAAGSDAVVDVTGYFTAAGGSGAQFNAEAAPVRICDTRTGNPSGLAGAAAQCNGRTLAPNGELTVQVTGLAGVPAGAGAVAINVTVTNTTRNGYLTAFPGGTSPMASNLNWISGETVANMVIATLGSGGSITLYNSAGSTDVLVDVMGWYQ